MTLGYSDADGMVLWDLHYGLPFDAANPESYDHDQQPFHLAGASSSFSLPGDMSFFVMSTNKPRPKLSQLRLSTSSVLLVTLNQCVDSTAWSDMFYALTGADRSTVQVQIEGTLDDDVCKGTSRGKALVNS